MLPRIIQGGMGVAISNWRLAQAVSRLGQLGVVSGTALDQILVRRLQDGDRGGHMRRALDRFPFAEIADRIWRTYYIAGGKAARQPYTTLPMQAKDPDRSFHELCMAANFVEVSLARDGHDQPVGINYLEKIQIPHLPSIYGAMLAGVDYVLMGAGIPTKIPGVLDRFAAHRAATYPLSVTGALPDDDMTLRFDPDDYGERPLPPLKRPLFLPIVASNVLAKTLQRKSSGRVDGFIVEGPTAGGHNAPPRGKLQLNAAGEPMYGERDRVDLKELRDLGLPFWLAGGYGRADKLREALDAGAAGIQVGTAFALCAESGLKSEYRAALLRKVVAGAAMVVTDPLASPAGFPFKVAQLEGSLSDSAAYAERPRICDLGYLREAYRTTEGGVAFRCPAEPPSLYIGKGGAVEDTVDRKCICNALISNVGHPQTRGAAYIESGLVTAGDDLAGVGRFLAPGASDYSAADVIAALLDEKAERAS
jgi:nitronate monooxygenase